MEPTSNAKYFSCPKCSRKYGIDEPVFRCKECGQMLDIEYDYGKVRKSIPKGFKSQPPTHWKYKMFYPIEDMSKVVTLCEGGTPLIKSDKLSRKSNAEVFLKYEGVNPTGSFKDRGSAVEITKALERNARSTVCASTGNMGASIAAYSAKANLRCRIILPSHVTKSKIWQIKAYNARIEFVHGSYHDAFERAEELSRKGYYLTGDYPFRCEGQKSIGFEICDQLAWNVPDFVICPIGNGTVIYAIWKAFNELKEVGLTKRLPKIVGMQAEGCSPAVDSFLEGLDYVKPIHLARTIASAIACEDPLYGRYILKTVRDSGGFLGKVSDREMIMAVKALGKEGIFVEPSGAASVAGLINFSKKFVGARVVCINSGHGLKAL